MGAGLIEQDAALAVTLTAAGRRVGFLSCTTVNGDFVNDALPASGPAPAGTPASEAWQYELRALRARLDLYHFDDTNPTEDPESTLLRSIDLTLPIVPGDGAWDEALADFPSDVLDPIGGRRPNALLSTSCSRDPRKTSRSLSSTTSR